MRTTIEDWEFEVDVSATAEYSAKEALDHCDCAYCRNFYAAVDNHYPGLRPLLERFGANVEAPDALMPYDRFGAMTYEAFYSVRGRVVTAGQMPIRVGNAVVCPGRFPDLQIDMHCDEPYLFLNVSNLMLPWVLLEPMDQVISPANQPSFLRKIWNRLLKKKNIPDS